MYRASLIISVYKDVDALNCILAALQFQTEKQFEIIVSEDGDSAAMREFLTPHLFSGSNLLHLNQEDKGFRKNRALNRAVLASRSDYLVFIDGDCVPHTRFLEAHLQERDPVRICCGRRLEMGKNFSRRLIRQPALIKTLSSPLKYLGQILSIEKDGGKNPEGGLYLPLAHHFLKNKTLPIVGCNFSCTKEAMLAINGFNEDFESPGLGEDSDLEWRFEKAGYRTKNVKFIAPLFHLYHDRIPYLDPKNIEIYNTTRRLNEWRCARGLYQARGA